MSGNYAYTSHLWPSVLIALFLFALSVYIARRRSVPGALPLMVACLFAALWAAGSVMEYAAIHLATRIFWVKFQAAWQMPVATAVTCFVLEYTWPGRWLTRRNLALLSVPPILILLVILTDDLFHLVWRGFTVAESIQPQFGTVGWIAFAYVFGFLGTLNLVVFGWLFLHSPRHRWPVVLMLVGQFGGRTLYMSERAGRLHSVLPIDMLGMAFEFLVYALALFGFHILDPIRMARQTVIEQLHAGMLVLDLQGKILSLNPAARKIFGAATGRLRGRMAEELLPACLKAQLAGDQETEIELSLGAGPALRHYALEASPLKDWRGLVVGRLLMLHDVTDQRKAQAQLLEQQQALARSQEREILARDLHDELSQDLSFINVEAQAVCDELAAGQVEQASMDLQRLAKIAREAQVEVRGQITRLSLDALSKEGFPGALRQFVNSFWSMYGIQAELCMGQDQPEYLMEPTTEVQLLRIFQEAFTNIRKHANARKVRVVLENPPGRVVLSIEDDGVGFDPAENAAGRATFGLRIMSQRAAEMGGCVTIHSNPGAGTRVVVDVPVSGRYRSANESLAGR